MASRRNRIACWLALPVIIQGCATGICLMEEQRLVERTRCHFMRAGGQICYTEPVVESVCVARE
jgi:hypothetical protein